MTVEDEGLRATVKCNGMMTFSCLLEAGHRHPEACHYTIQDDLAERDMLRVQVAAMGEILAHLADDDDSASIVLAMRLGLLKVLMPPDPGQIGATGPASAPVRPQGVLGGIPSPTVPRGGW